MTPLTKNDMETASLVALTHDQLVSHAGKWLRSIGCSVVLLEVVSYCPSGEIPDAIGWRNGRSILIECKTSRSDFRADEKKLFRRSPDMGMGDWRIYLCEEGLIQPEELPHGWGLLWVCGSKIKRIHGVPTHNTGWWEAPLNGNKRNENSILVSALRRIQK